MFTNGAPYSSLALNLIFVFFEKCTNISRYVFPKPLENVPDCRSKNIPEFLRPEVCEFIETNFNTHCKRADDEIFAGLG